MMVLVAVTKQIMILFLCHYWCGPCFLTN